MLDIKVLRPSDTVGLVEMEQVRDFLFDHLDQYGDEKSDIMKAINYALNKGITPGGFVVVGRDEGEIVGAVVVNKTGMEGYIPENILVYIAAHREKRGKGYGKAMMQKAIETAEGNIALHVEPDNPAKHLYEKLGFTNKYLEMRLNKS
ncbi:GNAT family N-acetyltransferase [Marinoscillum sp.]|uniref:GNAT family N-acetyltransferase n=1 Tax=Marinoscillum sp. TaxID=2024838 RepID=UPI003BAAE66B